MSDLYNYRRTSGKLTEPALNKTMELLKNAWEGIKLTWAEWHAIVIGLGDGVAFTKTDWFKVYPLYGNDMAQELHYYKFGLALGRLTWALIIALLLIRLLG